MYLVFDEVSSSKTCSTGKLCLAMLNNKRKKNYHYMVPSSDGCVVRLDGFLYANQYFLEFHLLALSLWVVGILREEFRRILPWVRHGEESVVVHEQRQE